MGRLAILDGEMWFPRVHAAFLDSLELSLNGRSDNQSFGLLGLF